MPALEDYQILLTKILAYAPLYGQLSSKSDSFKASMRSNGISAAAKKTLEYDFSMPYSEASEYFENLGIIDAPTFYADLDQYAGQAFTISFITKEQTLISVKNEISNQLGSGVVDPEKLAEVIQNFAVKNGDDPLKPFHIETIIRTNVQTAFSKGRYLEQLESPNDLWFYDAIVDGRETPLCNSLDGKAFSKNDPFWSSHYPPNHFNCRSGVASLDAETAKEFGIKIEKSGEKLIERESKKFPDQDFKVGKGFNNSPDKGLSKWLNSETKKLKIDNIKNATPQFENEDEKKFYEQMKKANDRRN